MIAMGSLRLLVGSWLGRRAEDTMQAMGSLRLLVRSSLGKGVCATMQAMESLRLLADASLRKRVFQASDDIDEETKWRFELHSHYITTMCKEPSLKKSTSYKFGKLAKNIQTASSISNSIHTMVSPFSTVRAHIGECEGKSTAPSRIPNAKRRTTRRLSQPMCSVKRPCRTRMKRPCQTRRKRPCKTRRKRPCQTARRNSRKRPCHTVGRRNSRKRPSTCRGCCSTGDACRPFSSTSPSWACRSAPSRSQARPSLVVGGLAVPKECYWHAPHCALRPAPPDRSTTR